MQVSPFGAAVQGLKDVRPGDLVAQLNRVFTHITQFTPDQAVAAYQSLDLMGDILQGEDGEKVIEHLKKAVVLHMERLSRECYERKMGINQTMNMNKLFEKITGEKRFSRGASF